MSKKQLKQIIIIIIVMNCILPVFTNNLFFSSNSSNGYNLFQFLLLYFIGAYIKLYNPLENFKINLTQKRFLLLSITFLCIIFNFSLFYLGQNMLSINNSFIQYFENNIVAFNILYNNPLVLIQTISFFLFISTITIKSKFINVISSTTLGIYI